MLRTTLSLLLETRWHVLLSPPSFSFPVPPNMKMKLYGTSYLREIISLSLNSLFGPVLELLGDGQVIC